MGKRYHCDYCERSFQDTLHNRKKHLNGVQHQRNKKTWFDRFRGAVDILQEENAKQPCRKFQQTGQCIFGPSCRYSHLSVQDMRSLERHIHEERHLYQYQTDTHGTPSLEDWLSRREKRTVMSSGSVFKLEETPVAEEPQVPPFLLCIPDLPVSLLPQHAGGWGADIFIDWG